MNPISLIVDKSKSIEVLIPKRLAFYKQGQVIEATNDQSEFYYLFFYKQQFLTAVKTKSLRRHSYMAKAFSKGHVYQAPHPFIQALVTSETPLQRISYPQLMKKLEHSYSNQEKAHILTFFESFVPKKQLFQEIKSLFYQYRREGKMFAAYTIVRELMDFAPNQSFVKQVGNDLSFSKFAAQYTEKAPELFVKDPLFAEQCLSFQEKSTLLLKENRWIEAANLYRYKLAVEPLMDDYKAFVKLIESYFDETGTTNILKDLAEDLPAFGELTHDLFQKHLQNQNIAEISRMMTDRQVELDPTQLRTLAGTLEQMELQSDLIHPEWMHPLIEQILMKHPDKAEPILEKYIIALLETCELSSVCDQLEPFQAQHGHLSILEKVEQMNRIRDDLDHMQQLGEWYYELLQLDKALECFQLEMEMNPSDPKPLRWLSQIYQDKQMVHESKIYQQLCIDVQKWA